MDISRTENWMQPVMPMDASWRPMHAWTIGRHYAIALIVAMRPAFDRIMPIVLRALVGIAVLMVMAFVVWVLQGDSSAGGLQTTSPWGPGSGVLQASGK